MSNELQTITQAQIEKFNLADAVKTKKVAKVSE